jgi:hypothetical protein
MMKKIILSALAFVLSFGSFAQSQNGTASFNKATESAVIYDMNYPLQAVENGLEKKMANWGKPKKVKGYTMYRNVRISEISKDPITLYFSADKKSNKDNDNSILTLLIANEFDRFYKADENSELFSNAKSFLNGFAEPVAAANLELKINDKEDVVKKSDKKLKGFRDDSIDYEKQKKKLEEKIAQNVKDIEIQEKELAKQKEELDALIKQRKN